MSQPGLATAWREKTGEIQVQREKPEPVRERELDASAHRNGGGPGWGTGQKKWRIAAGMAMLDTSDKAGPLTKSSDC